MIYFDLFFLFAGWLIAQFVFHGYEAHVPLSKRLTKFGIIFIIFAIIHYVGNRALFYGLLGIMTLGIAFLHGYWFHIRHGIHWRKAEPRDKYLKLIGYVDKDSPS